MNERFSEEIYGRDCYLRISLFTIALAVFPSIFFSFFCASCLFAEASSCGQVRYVPGMAMLSLFKNSPLKTSILDDFLYYEERQRILHEEKAGLLGRNYPKTLFLPGFPSPKRSIITIKHPLKREKLVESTPVDHSGGSMGSSLSDVSQDGCDSPVMRMGSLSLASEEAPAARSNAAAAAAAAALGVEYVTVGSMSVKVDKCRDPPPSETFAAAS